jgi:amino acid adenylation domain-containing protein
MTGYFPANSPRDALDLILRHAESSPNARAVEDDDDVFTYAELRERVVAAASGLSSLGVAPYDRVAILLPNSADFVITALGCLWLGAAFVPLSVDDPPARLAAILSDVDPAIVVAQVPMESSQPVRTVQPETHVTDVATILASAGSGPDRCFDRERDAYLIYTSGTSGAPKGVRIPERAFRWAINHIAEAVGILASTRALSVSSYHFDGSYGTLFPTLISGGSVVIPRREELIYLKRFFTAVLEQDITFTGFSPTYLRLVLSSPHLHSLEDSRLSVLGLGGEECSAKDLMKLWEVLPTLRVFNRYGPTETTIQVTTHEVDPASLEFGRVPIGTPHKGVSFHMVDEDGRAVDEAGEVGELYIGGEQLMRGYWRDEELTSKVLSFQPATGELNYKTGDLVRRDDAGRYYYVGRSDDVIKRRGVRISLGEIAYCLATIPHVSEVICAPTDIDGELGIAAFVQADADVTLRDLLEAARGHVPASMLPDDVVLVDSFPMTPSGKVDRIALLTSIGRKAWS